MLEAESRGAAPSQVPADIPMSTQPSLPVDVRMARSLDKIARELHVMNLINHAAQLDYRGQAGREGRDAFGATIAAHFALDHEAGSR